MQVEALLRIPAPEYVVFRHEIAGPFSRLFAVILDFLLTAALILASLLILAIVDQYLRFSSLLRGLETFLLYLFFFLINWFYFFLFERYNRGRTPGKMFLSLRVSSLDGTGLDPSQILIRNLLRIADMFPFIILPWIGLYLPSYALAGIICALRGRPFQRLGDIAAGTIVIREQKRRSLFNVPLLLEERVQELAGRLNPRSSISPTLARALNDYAHRRFSLSEERFKEIARAEEESLRRLFRAEDLECEPEELMLAAFHFLYQGRNPIRRAEGGEVARNPENRKEALS